MYTLVCYQESCNIDLAIKSMLELYPKCKYYISPLHDNDIQEDGSFKKPHWHVVLDFEIKDSKSPKKEKQKVASLFGISDGLIKSVRNLTGVLRYHVHKDDLSKYQYLASQELTNDKLTFESALIQNAKSSASDNMEGVLQFIDMSFPEPCEKIEVFRYMRQHKLFLQLSSVMSFIEYYLDYYNRSLLNYKMKQNNKSKENKK